MKSQKSHRTHALLIERGENIVENILAYCIKNSIFSGHLVGIGAVEHAELMHYEVDDKKYTSKTFSEPMEIANLSGNISLFDGKPHAHCHISLGRKDFSVVGGHLKEARVHAVCEIMLIESDMELAREEDDRIGLKVWRM